MMPGKVNISERELVISEEVEDIYRKEISTFGTGAHVVCPKKHKGKKAYLVVCKE